MTWLSRLFKRRPRYMWDLLSDKQKIRFLINENSRLYEKIGEMIYQKFGQSDGEWGTLFLKACEREWTEESPMRDKVEALVRDLKCMTAANVKDHERIPDAVEAVKRFLAAGKAVGK